MQKVMQNYKLSKKFKTSFLTSILAIGICISPFAFAENPLVTQAKELQTGSEKIGIDHRKAIALLKKASDEGDAEAMYLLSQYYSGHYETDYLPPDTALYDQILFSSAKLSNYSAMREIFFQYYADKLNYGKSNLVDKIKILKPIVKKDAESKPEAMTMMAFIYSNELAPNSNFQACQWAYRAFQAGDKFGTYAFESLICNSTLLKKLNAPSATQLKAEFDQYLNAQLVALKKKSDQGSILAKLKILDYYQMYVISDVFSAKEIDKIKKQIEVFKQKQTK